MIKSGDKVSYCSIINGKITSKNHIVKKTGTLPSGTQVAWITGKAGCVDIDALIKEEKS